jgi:hypothetical protein
MSDTKAEVEQEAQARLLHNLFMAAMEGGIEYWSSCSEYRWMLNHDVPAEMPVDDLDGFKAVLKPSPPEEFWGVFDGDDDEKPLTVDKDVMQLGLVRWQEWMTTDRRNVLGGLVEPDSASQWLRDPVQARNEYWKQFSRDVASGRFDAADYDADLADAVVQLGLFNKVVFG